MHFFVVCLVSHSSSSIFTFVELDFTWSQGVFDKTSLSPFLSPQCGTPLESCMTAYTSHTHVTLLHPVAGDITVLDKQWQLRRGISMTDGYWLYDAVICFCTAAQLISEKETQETLLDYYSQRLSVILHWIPYLIYLSFALQNILVIFNNIAG